MNIPAWEHSYRRHGLWVGLERVGYIGLSLKNKNKTVYSYNCCGISGRVESLRIAKRKVEEIFEKHSRHAPFKKV